MVLVPYRYKPFGEHEIGFPKILGNVDFSLAYSLSMATGSPQFLYMLDEDLYRLGNGSDSKLAYVRSRDLDVYQHNDTSMVRANGKGVSLITEKRLSKLPQGSGWAWKLPANVPMPHGLVLYPDLRDIAPGERPEHYFLCPAPDMPNDALPGTTTATYEFDAWRAQYMLEALNTLEEKWTAIVQNTEDEDVQADHGNDIAQIQILKEGFERVALQAFGPHVKEFSREPL